MLLDALNAVLQLADLYPVSDNGRVIIDKGATNAADLLAHFFFHVQQVGSNVGPQRVYVTLQFVPHGLNIRFHFSDFGP